jgi:hypothetical protein
VDGKCREILEETRRLIVEEVVRMPYVEMSMISLSASKTFLVRHLLAECNDGKVELFKTEELEQIQNKFYELSSPNVRNLVASFKHHLGGGYINSPRVGMTTSKNVASLDKVLNKRCSFSR